MAPSGSVRSTVYLLRALLVGLGVDAVVEGQGEGVEGGLPAGDPALAAAAGGVEAADRQVDALERGLLGREVAAGAHRAAQPGVHALDRVGAVEHAADLEIVGQEGYELGPGRLPQPHDRRVALAP